MNGLADRFQKEAGGIVESVSGSSNVMKQSEALKRQVDDFIRQVRQ